MSEPGSIDGIEPGRQLIRSGGEQGASLAARLAAQLQRLAWRSPLHGLRLRGRYPLKLLAVPADPIPGHAGDGAELLEGWIRHRGVAVELAMLDFADPATIPAALVDHIQTFGFLRDLAAAAPRERAAPIAELIVRQWLGAHGGGVTDAGWRTDHWGRRILAWGAHAPLILSSHDIVYRSAVLNVLAQGARHLDRGADKTPAGLPRIAAWAGVVTAGLLIPGGDVRLAHGEQGLARVLAACVLPDGGLTNRSPTAQLDLVELLSQLVAVYEARRRAVPDMLAAVLARAVPALLGVTLGDGGLSSWQGGGPVSAARVATAVTASGIRTRPLRQARDWGYQRLSAQGTLVVMDAAPPPVARASSGGCASTLAFEMSDGPRRLVVNCGGSTGLASLPTDLAEGLRTTAAHSTLTLADANSTALNPDGSLGRGVKEVELDRQELDAGSRIDASHDGYARRHGLIHRRQLMLSVDGRELRGEDVLLPAPRRRRTGSSGFSIRFHLAPGISASVTADGLGALLRFPDGGSWQFRCRGGALAVEDSLWIDPAGRPRATCQLVLDGEVPAGGAEAGWVFRRMA
ncbi:heparinase II/III family protein [Sphingomonas montana]|uniref:heparinase II/III family protein n=1 Tax=Sphingomonas montana TaxID=1843236 RepID=UPI00096E51B3|nr:heparinase II/III family protein [Sphingomonas montana]